MEWHYPNQNWELYYVADGKIRFDVEGETYIAEKDCLVHIPPYHTHELEVLEDAQMFDYGGETYTLELLEDYKSLQTHQPEKLKDPEFGFCIYDNIDDSAFGDSAAFAHRHPFYEIVFIEDADGAHIIDYTAYDDLKNVVFLISPGQVHYWKNVTRAKGIPIYFQEEFLFQSSISVSSVWEIQLFKEMVEMPAIYMDEDFAQTMRAVCRMMLKEYESKSPDYAQVLRACLNILLIYFHRRHREIAHQGIERTPGMAGELHLRLQNLIDQRVCENLSVSEYAEILGVSQSHLNEQIKKITGKTVGTLIREAQFSEAKRLLVNTELNVTEIAETMRFQDTAYFCRAFKRQVGMSPSQYRAKCRENKVSQ